MLKCVLLGEQSLFGGESPVLVADGKSPRQVAWPCAGTSPAPKGAGSILTMDSTKKYLVMDRLKEMDLQNEATA